MDVPFMIFLVSLVPFPLVYVLSTQPWMHGQLIVLAVGIGCLALIIIMPCLAVRKMKKPDFILYVMSLFMFSSMIYLIIALEADGILSEFMTFYLHDGEPYLWTAHGTMINYWDGIVHYAMCLWILYCISNGKSYRKVGLYWVGSITNSLLVLVPGSVLGKFGVKPAILLNIPYFFVPVWIGYRLLKNKQFTSPIKTLKSDLRSIWKRPIDMMFVVYLLGAAGVDLFRGFIALGCKEDLMQEYLYDHEPYIMDPTAYPKTQMLINMMYFVPYYACAIYGLVSHGQSWMADWSLLYAGAAAQGQFSYIGGSFHYKTAPELHVPPGDHSRNVFWLINIALSVVPQLFALRLNAKSDLKKTE